MSAMTVISTVVAVFSVLGAADYLLGNKLGLGKEFEKAFSLLGTMALTMVGMLVLAPQLAHWMSPALTRLAEHTAFGRMEGMDDKGVVFNSAFAVSAAFSFAGHLAFTMSFEASYLPAVITGKLISGVAALVVAGFVYKKVALPAAAKGGSDSAER